MAYENETQDTRDVEDDAPEMRMEIETTPTIGKLVAALALAQAKMEGAKRDVSNPHVGKKYADLASCWEAWRPAGPPNGLALIQIPCNPKADVVVVKTILACGEERITSTLTMPVAVQMVNRERNERSVTAQSVGSAITYARRYSFMAMVGIAPEEDDGNAASGRGNGHDSRSNGQQTHGTREGSGSDSRASTQTQTQTKPAPVQRPAQDTGPIEVLTPGAAIERFRTKSAADRKAWWGSPSGQKSRDVWIASDKQAGVEAKVTERRVLSAFHALDAGDDVDADGVVVPKDAGVPADKPKAQAEPGSEG